MFALNRLKYPKELILLEALSYQEINVSSNSKNQMDFRPGKNYTVYITIDDGTGDYKYDLKFTDSSFQ